MESNFEIYDQCRIVPENAKKPIGAGRLKGMTNINPMWRIKKLTEVFGPSGFGWYIENVKRDIHTGSNDEQIAIVELDLIVKYDGEWSKPIHGVGGSMMVEKERNGMYTDDEAFKKAYTDAISVACKALGVGADVYWNEERTKHDKPAEQPQTQAQAPQKMACAKCGKEITGYKAGNGDWIEAERVIHAAQSKYNQNLCAKCMGYDRS